MKPLAVMSFVAIAASLTLAAESSPATDPSTPYFNLDVSRAHAPVYIVNRPHTQTPGTVNVGNLPFYADGSVGVTTVPASTNQPVLLELLLEPIVLGTEPTVIGTLDTRGFSSISFLALSNSAVSLIPKWRWNDDEPFGEVHDVRFPQLNCSNVVESGSGDRVACSVAGPELELSIAPHSGGHTTVTMVRVYLIP